MATAVMRSSTGADGLDHWLPSPGFISDRIGRRKPVIAGRSGGAAGCLVWILHGPADVLPPYVLGLVAGIASGAAMLPYSVIKEANPPDAAGTATGVVNFLNFTFSALLGPVFGWLLDSVSGGAPAITLEHYQASFEPLLYGVVLAIVLTLPAEGDRTRGATDGCHEPRARTDMSQVTGTGKYEQLLARCQGLSPLPTAVAHPCEATALAGAMEAGEGLIMPILVGPAAKIQEVAKASTASISAAARSSTRRTAMRRRRRRSSWCARARPSC